MTTCPARPRPVVNQMADQTVFASEVGFIRDAAALTTLAAGGAIRAGEHRRLHRQLASLCRPLYQPRQVRSATG